MHQTQTDPFLPPLLLLLLLLPVWRSVSTPFRPQERQALATRQQELLQLHNGHSLDLPQQQACAERLALVVRKERFLSHCLATFVVSICSVLQIAKLTQLVYPYCPQIPVLGTVLAKKLQEREETARQEQEQRRRLRSTHGLNIP